MLIYQNTTNKFIEDIRGNMIGNIMSEAYFYQLGKFPSPGELGAFQNSLSRVRDLIELAELHENYIVLEYEVPYNQSRVDCLIFGKDELGNSNMVLIELKQWSSVKSIEDEGNFVETYLGKGNRIVPHPSQQVKGYDKYLRNFVEVFDAVPPILLFSCAYCHNYKKENGYGLYDPIYKKIIEDFPIYSSVDTKELAKKLQILLSIGEGFEVYNRFMLSPIRPTKKLLENVSKIVNNNTVFSLLNEQIVAKNLILSKLRKCIRDKKKAVIIVHGGPGTGKSLIALNILAETAKKYKKIWYACKSKPFIEGLKKLVGEDADSIFTNLYRFVPSKAKENEFNLLLVDEAHRIEKNSNHQYTKPNDRTDMPQINQIIRCTKTSVFFIDDKQNVRSQEIGNSELIKRAAKNLDCMTYEVTLETQFRCMGSNDYLLWIESVLGYKDENRMLKKNEVFDFKIFNSPKELYKELQIKENIKSNSARMVAGFCWPWSKTLDEKGDLIKDIKIGDFAMPWETHSKISRIPKGYVKWYEWAYRPEGFKQVGCIYTAQGFEFDYVGVIIGDDLIYNDILNRLIGNIEATKDPTLKKSKENFESHVRNIYRTLLTRGMKGCYVYFTDKKTEEYFRSRIE